MTDKVRFAFTEIDPKPGALTIDNNTRSRSVGKA